MVKVRKEVLSLRDCLPKGHFLRRGPKPQWMVLRDDCLVKGMTCREYLAEKKKRERVDRAQKAAAELYTAITTYDPAKDLQQNEKSANRFSIFAQYNARRDDRYSKYRFSFAGLPRRKGQGFVRKEKPSWISACVEAQARRVEHKKLLALIPWWELRQSRRDRLFKLRTLPWKTASQKEEIIRGWLPLDFVMSPEFIMRDSTYLDDRIPTFSSFKHDHYERFSLGDVFQGEMDAHGSENEVANSDVKSNVILEDNRDISLAQPLPDNPRDSYLSFASVESPLSASTVSDRWLTIGQERWKASDSMGKVLTKIELPKFAIASYGDSPNIMPFMQHVYWRGNMKVKIVINSNLRQYGQLQVRFYYGSNQELLDDFETCRTNVYVGSQQPHCLISANTSNVGELHIPFEYFRPLLFVAGAGANAVLGTLIVSVLVPLKAIATTQQECNLSVLIAFEENDFSGLVYRNMKAEMLPTIIKRAFKFLNEDKPTEIDQGKIVIPQNSPNWCAGTGTSEWSVPLRLNPKGMLPYGAGRIPNLDEMNINYISSIYGLVKQLHWASNMKVETNLWSFEASPTWKFDQYPFVEIDGVNCAVFPPVSVISSMFAYWRGSLSLRLDIVGAADLSGRLIVAFVPRCAETNLSIKQLVSCSHVIFDLQEKRQFSFNIPFQTDRMYWPVRKTLMRQKTAQVPPGRVFISVYNDLIANSTIPDDCYINCYLAGGEDFEVAVPVAPIIGTAFNPKILTNLNTNNWTKFKQGYYPGYPGSWRLFGESKYYIMRYGSTSDHVCQMVGSSDVELSKLIGKVLVPNTKFVCEFKTKINGVIDNSSAKFFVLWQVDNRDYYYLVPFKTLTKATKFASSKLPKDAEVYVEEALSYAAPPQMFFVPNTSSRVNVIDKNYNRKNEGRWVGQMDERSSTGLEQIPVSPPSKTGSGQALFGEKFNDLKDLCRRFQMYAKGKTSVIPDSTRHLDLVQLRFPAMPQGLEIDVGNALNIDEYWNRTRDGPIPLISSGYKFFTGGLRFRVIVNCFDETGNNIPAKIFVQHRPNISGLIPYVTEVNYQDVATEDLLLPGFAYHVQMENVNSIVSVDVPYYLPNIRGYLQRPPNNVSAGRTHSLGEVVVSVRTSTILKYNFSYEIYYSLSDDSRFALFQGFPPMVSLLNLPDLHFKNSIEQPQLNVPAISNVPEIIPNVNVNTVETEEEEDESNFIIVNPRRGARETGDWTRFRTETGFPYVSTNRFFKALNRLRPDITLDPTAESILFFIRMIIEQADIKDFQIFVKYLAITMNVSEDDWPEDLWQNRPSDEDYVIPPKINTSAVKEFIQRVNYDLVKSYMGKPYAFVGEMENSSKPQTGLFGNIRKSAENLAAINPDLINQAVGEAKDAAEKFSSVAEKTETIIDDTQTFLDKVKNLFNGESPIDGQSSELMDKFLHISVNITMFLADPQISTFCLAFYNVLHNLGILTVKTLMQLSNSLKEFLFSCPSAPNEHDEGARVGEIDFDYESALASYSSTLIAGVAGVMNFTNSYFIEKKSLCKILLKDIREFSMTSNHLFTFCRNNIEGVKWIFESLWRTGSGEMKLDFFESLDESIYDWAKDCMWLTDGANRDMLFGDYVKANKVYDCANRACLIQLKILALAKDKAIPADKSKVLYQLCNKIVKLRDDLARAHVAPPVKFEPFVLHIAGEKGIGKSHLSQELPIELLQSIRYKTFSEPIYTRVPGNAYWNLLSHQPIVLYDDWYQMNSQEHGLIQLAELFCLKTRAVFNPPMANVEDKNIRYNPLIVMLSSNDAYPKYQYVQDVNAVHRRVDFLIQARLTEPYRDIPNFDVNVHVDPEVKAVYGHLEFTVLPKFPTAENLDARQYVSIDELRGQVNTTFRLYYERELEKYTKAVRKISALYPQEGEEAFKLPSQQFWTSTEAYLEAVNLEDHKFNQNYTENIYKLLNRKFRSAFHAIIDLFPNWKGEMLNEPEIIETIEDNMKTVCYQIPVSDSQDNASNSDYEDCEEIVETLTFEGKCGHDLLVTCQQLGCYYEWMADAERWMIEMDETSCEFLVNKYPQFFDNVNDPKDRTKETQQHGSIPADYVTAFLVKLLGEQPESLTKVEIDIVIPKFIHVDFDVEEVRWLYFRKNEVVFDRFGLKFYIPHVNCTHKKSICKFGLTLRNLFVSNYLTENTLLNNMFISGESLIGYVPEEFLDCLNGKAPPQEFEEKLSWLKGFWKTCRKLYSAPDKHQIYRTLSRIAWVFSFFAPLLLALSYIYESRKSIKQSVKNMDDSGVIRAIIREELQNSKGQGFASGDHRVSGSSRSPKLVASKMLDNVHKGEMPTTELETLQRSLRNNTFYLYLTTPECSEAGRCLGVYGNIALLPYHTWETMERRGLTNNNLYYINSINPVAIKLNVDRMKCIRFKDSSLCLLKLPKNIPLFKDIRSRFATQEQHSKLNGRGYVIEVTKPLKEHGFSNLNTIPLTFEHYASVEVSRTNGIYDAFTVPDGYSYRDFHGAGKCGAVLCAENLPSPIIGMHVAGCSISGISEVVTREMLEPRDDMFSGEIFDVQEPLLFDPSGCKANLETEVITLGRVEPRLQHRESEKSRIKPSLIQQHGDKEEFPVYTEVAVLSPRDPRIKEAPFSPMIEGCSHHGKSLSGFDCNDLKTACHDLENLYLAKCKPQRLGVGKLSKLQAAAGIDGLDGYDALEWRSSEGFPFVAMRPRGVHDKKWLFDFKDQKCVGIKDILRKTMKEKKSLRLKKTVPFTVFTDCLKDTTIAREKVLQPGKTRVFSMAPVDFTLAERQLTLDFCVAMMRNRLDLEHAVGINPDSREWTLLASKLLSKGSKIVTGDYSKFGDTIPFEIVQSFFNLINKWYNKYSKTNTQEHNLQREVMAYEVGHAAHLMLDNIYKCVCGQPSGNALTVLLNSYANSVYVRLAWLKIMRGTKWAGLKSFREHVCMFSYGDDIIIAVSDDVASYFNACSMCDFFALYGLKFTNADKSDTIVPFGTIWEAEFLKRGFVKHPFRKSGPASLLMAPLGKASIEDTVNWIWDSGYDSCNADCPEFRQMCMQVCEDATRNAWTRGPSYYVSFTNKLERFWQSINEYVVYDSWSVIDEKVFDLNLCLWDNRYVLPSVEM